jgi:ribonuclease T2
MERIACAVALTMALASCSTTPPPPPTPEARRSLEEKPDAPPPAPTPPPTTEEKEAPKPQMSERVWDLEKDCREDPKWRAGKEAKFPFYLLALTWGPGFCAGKQSKSQCKTMPGSFAADHLTLHGLWPNYDVPEPVKPEGPFFCAQYDVCKAKAHEKDEICTPGLDVIPKSMRKYGPGYLTDDNFLANHEWPKHGSCTGLPPCDYMTTEIKALLALPGDQGTPEILRHPVDGKVDPEALRAAFGTDKDAVVLSCSEDCTLVQVGICLGKEKGRPGAQMKCPESVTGSDYDNGCILRNCAAIKLGKSTGTGTSTSTATSTGTGTSTSTATSTSTGTSTSTPGSKKPVKGPRCKTNDECNQVNYLRCAKSGFCTDVPK